MPDALGSGYLLDERIGRGATGDVWRGHAHDGRQLAFKLLRPELVEDRSLVSRFMLERTLLTGVDHPNLVRVHDLVAEGGRLAIVMELVAGHDLRKELLERGTLPAAEALTLTQQVLQGVAALHAAGIVHRDLKPANILLSRPDGTTVLKVTDYGTARLVNESAATRATSIIGTPEYLAPEMAEGIEVVPGADVYSAGVVLYELLCAVTPFAGGHPLAVLRRHVEQRPDRPDDIADSVWDLLTRMLAKSPGDRPLALDAADECRTLASRLTATPASPRPTVSSRPEAETILRGLPRIEQEPPTPQPSPRWRSRALIATAMAGILVVLGGAVGSALALRGGDADEVASVAVPPVSTPTSRPTERPTATVVEPPVPDFEPRLQDANGDGKADVVHRWEKGVTTSLSRGDGTYDAVTQQAPDADYPYLQGNWANGDLNGDGLTDLAHRWPGGADTWISVGDGTYRIASLDAHDPKYPYAEGMWKVGDVTKDGLDDIVHPTSGGIRTWTSQRDGTYVIASFRTQNPTYPYVSGSWKVRDITGNGAADLLHQWSGGVNVWVSKGDGTYTIMPLQAPNAEYPYAQGEWTVGDLTADGRVDLVHHWDSGLMTWISEADGSYRVVSGLDSNYEYKEGSWRSGDVTGDGIPDLVHQMNARLDTLISQGDGTYEVVTAQRDRSVEPDDDTGEWRVLDVTGDGKADLVSWWEDKANTWISAGAGTYHFVPARGRG